MSLLSERLALYDAPQKAKALGVYPYFRAITSDQDTVVQIDGKPVLMFGSNSYLGLTNHPRIKEGAIKATEKKVERVPDKADIVIQSGLANAEKGLISKALEDFKKAMEISPTNTEALVNFGFLNTTQGNFKDAFDAYARLSVANPDEPLGHLGLGNLYWLGGQAEKAVEQWTLINDENFYIEPNLNILALNEKVWSRS